MSKPRALSPTEEWKDRQDRHFVMESQKDITLEVTRPGGKTEKVRIPKKEVVFPVMSALEKLDDKTRFEVAYHITDNGRLKSDAAKATINVLAYGSLRGIFSQRGGDWEKSEREQQIHDLMSASIDAMVEDQKLFFNKAIVEQKLSPDEVDMIRRGFTSIDEYREVMTEMHAQAAIAARELKLARAEPEVAQQPEVEPDFRLRYEEQAYPLPHHIQKAFAEIGLNEHEARNYFIHLSKCRKEHTEPKPIRSFCKPKLVEAENHDMAPA